MKRAFSIFLLLSLYAAVLVGAVFWTVPARAQDCMTVERVTPLMEQQGKEIVAIVPARFSDDFLLYYLSGGKLWVSTVIDGCVNRNGILVGDYVPETNA